MKRSEINRYLSETIDFFAAHKFLLPPWAKYSIKDWQNIPDIGEIVDCQLGWDITTFGSNDFRNMGLTLFTLRNGAPGYDKTYAEKIMMVRNGQVTPRHFHWSKEEDIINRGGGNLVIELFHADPAADSLTGKDFSISIDGVTRTMKSGDKLILTPGESVCFKSCHAHRFWGDGNCLIGEVSRVNDDANDNCFVDGMPRFDEIDEDEPPCYLLASDYKCLTIISNNFSHRTQIWTHFHTYGHQNGPIPP